MNNTSSPPWGVALSRQLTFAALAAAVVCALGCDSLPPQGDDAATGAATASDAGGRTSDAGKPSAGDAGAGSAKIDRSKLTDVGTDPGLDYGDPRLWLCRPGNDPDECNRDLDATELLADGERKVVPFVKAKAPEVDCFYVYPTVKLSAAGPMTDFSNIDITLDPLLSQGARFGALCRMYAPLYRQTGVVPGAGGAPTPGGTGFQLGQQDVRDAFAYYLKNWNQGRKFVLIGHSQGTGMLTGMIAADIDPKPAVQKQLVSALLIGGGVAVPEGEDVGGTFKNVPLCRTKGQTGCVISYVSFSKETPPSMSSTFGKAPADGQQLGCTEPAALAGRAGELSSGSYIARQRVNPTFAADGFADLPSDFSTPFLLYRDVFRSTCKNENGFSYLEVSLEMGEDDPRPSPPYRSAALEAALGLHLMDYNIQLGDLLDAVALQIEKAK